MIKPSNRYSVSFLTTHLANSVDVARNNICYDYFQDSVCLNNLNCVFVHKEFRYTNKTEIKNGLQSTKNKKKINEKKQYCYHVI